MMHSDKRKTFPGIPTAASVVGWESVEIRECGEPLVDLSKSVYPRIRIVPGYLRRGVRDAVDGCYLREGVTERLIHASEDLPTGYRFVIFDGWRPYKVQQALFDEFQTMLARNNPTLLPERLTELVKQYVSPPSTDPSRPSPHLTGGAVDLTIEDSSGALLDMGTDWDAFTPTSYTTYYESDNKSGNLSKADLHRRNNRRLLFHTLANAGFSNYHEEWWHYDYGNQFWARKSGSIAIYGGVAVL